MGHQAVTVCLVIANRRAKEANVDYNEKMKELIVTVLERI
jgi:uridine phosphorylase